MKYVAVEGMTLDFGTTSVPPGGVVLGPASLKASVDGHGVYAGPLSIMVTGAAMGSNTAGTGAGVFVPSSVRCTADGQKLLLEGDSATFIVAGTLSGVPVSWPVTATVRSAGQVSVKAE